MCVCQSRLGIPPETYINAKKDFLSKIVYDGYTSRG